ncbi:hypothetical protein WMY93_030593 [Mugilogobius chulae]|uniref:Pentraxin family member n=1 Tax=Mugilogobius chulae TaxID=88201 RepID=A0AAW0MR50_9GOBI
MKQTRSPETLIKYSCPKMEFQALFLSLILGMSWAVRQDLSGKMFTFPSENNWAHVKITTSKQYLSAATVCLRYFTDTTSRDTVIFSMSTPSHQNAILIFKKQQTGVIEVHVRNAYSVFNGQDFRTNTWQSVCVTWDSTSGLTQLWLDGKPSSRKYTTTSPISGPIIIVLGQEQDSHGGKFDTNQCFVGMISDLQMWDRVLTPDQIQNYNTANGSFISWASLEYYKTSRILVEDKLM